MPVPQQVAVEWLTRQAVRIVFSHRVPDVAAGTYIPNLGMYYAVMKVQLAVGSADGAVLPDGLLPLGTIGWP